MDKKQYYETLERLERYIESEFLLAVRDAVGSMPVGEIEKAIALGDIEQIMRLVDISDSVGVITLNAVQSAFVDGVIAEAAALRVAPNIRSVGAELWAFDKSSKLITYISDGVEQTVRGVISNGIAAGTNPRQTALQIVGRIDKATGRRSGGVVGLSRPQGQYVIAARNELLTLDPHYFTRTRRDRRFDLMVMRAINNETPLSPVDIERIAGRYADRLLVSRGEAIARTESIAALNAGREDSVNEAVSSGSIPERFITRIWDSTNDSRTRHDHRVMNGQKRAVGQPFSSPSGSLMMFPADPSLGALARDIINCRCYERIHVDNIGLAAHRMEISA